MTALTKRENQVCKLIVEGLNNKEIADRLGTSTRTVEEQRKAVFKKSGVRNAVELTLAVYGIKQFGPVAAETEIA
jgi:DNA-binding NarL/FixJ family response regulator